jgi:hypothetical protein
MGYNFPSQGENLNMKLTNVFYIMTALIFTLSACEDSTEETEVTPTEDLSVDSTTDVSSSDQSEDVTWDTHEEEDLGGTSDVSISDQSSSDHSTGDLVDDSSEVEEDVSHTEDLSFDLASISPEDLELNGHCSLDTKVGGFTVEVQELFSVASGKVTNGTIPTTILQEDFVEGDCRLMRRINPFCDPPCTSGYTCDFDGTCIDFPISQDIGTVTIIGLNKYLEMEPIAPGNNYFDTALPAGPIFDPGAVIRLQAEGGPYEPMELWGVGVEPIVADDAWVVVPEESLFINWTPSDAESVSNIFLGLNVDQHGNTPLTLYCNVEDTGEVEITATLIELLLNSGVSGYPSGTVTRQTVDSLFTTDGCVELIVGTPISTTVEVEGHTPCNNDLDCPEGQVCEVLIQTCVDEE